MVAGHADCTAATPSHCTTCNRMRSCKAITLNEGVATFELEACQHCATVSANGQAASSTNNGSGFAPFASAQQKGKQNFEEVDSDSSSSDDRDGAGSTASISTDASVLDVRNALADAQNVRKDAAMVLESLGIAPPPLPSLHNCKERRQTGARAYTWQ